METHKEIGKVRSEPTLSNLPKQEAIAPPPTKFSGKYLSATAKVDGTYLKELDKLVKTDLLILNDFGLQAFDNQDRETLMDIIDDRHGQKSIIISSQIPVSAWYETIGGEGTLADSVLDRIVNSSHRIDLKGESLRKGILKKE